MMMIPQKTVYYNYQTQQLILPLNHSQSFNIESPICIHVKNTNTTICQDPFLHIIQFPYDYIETEKVSFVDIKFLYESLDTNDDYESFYIYNYSTIFDLNSFVWIESIYPQYGNVSSTTFLIEFLIRVADNTREFNELIYQPHVKINIISMSEYILSMQYSRLSATDNSEIDPGSWFIEYIPWNISDNTIIGPITNNYIEFVLTPMQILNQRVFSLENINSIEDLQSNVCENDIILDEIVSSLQKPINICIWGSNSLDGQKRIWIEQIEQMNKTIFNFTWILSRYEDDSDYKKSHETIDILNGISFTNIIESPFNMISLSIDSLEEDPNDGSETISKTWDNNPDNVFKYAADRLRLFNFNLTLVRPLWIKHLYTIILDLFIDLQCDIVVYGNNRGFTSDVFITDSARLLNIPTVSELMNLYPHPYIIPSVFVGPSQYSIEHETVTEAIEQFLLLPYTQSWNNSRIVISPSVDTNLFDPNIELKRKVSSNCSDDFLSIGYVARLSIDKNPGLVLLTAKYLLSKYQHLRFIFIGDGAIKAKMEDLAKRLDINDSVEFVGWIVTEELPVWLKQLDIVINTSMRKGETFCISNIEVMSMSIPLVTFGVSGIGQYIDARPLDSFNHSNQSFQVMNNLVLVHEASPKAIGEAIEVLILNATLRNIIGVNARRTVLNYFSTSKQMKEYENLYLSLYQN